MTKELKTAIQAAHAAEKIALKHWRNKLTITTKTNWRDQVTQADLECDQAIRTIINNAFPDHDILSEEQSGDIHPSEWLWVIDPIDGTANFTMGEQIFGHSIGLLKNNQPYLGVISFPALQEIYWAEKGKGAWRRSYLSSNRGKAQRCRVSKNDKLKQCCFSTGFSYSNESRERFLDTVKPLLMNTSQMRINYCAVFDFMNVARGGMDFYINYNISLWDFAASWAIVKEAGGEMVTPQGKPITMHDCDIIGTNKKITAAMLRCMKN